MLKKEACLSNTGFTCIIPVGIKNRQLSLSTMMMFMPNKLDPYFTLKLCTHTHTQKDKLQEQRWQKNQSPDNTVLTQWVCGNPIQAPADPDDTPLLSSHFRDEKTEA